MVASASVTAGSNAGAGLRAASAISVVSAQKPFRARTWSPDRLRRTLSSWNFPSEGALELYPIR